jgi:hypothetical protein
MILHAPMIAPTTPPLSWFHSVDFPPQNITQPWLRSAPEPISCAGTATKRV